MASIADLEAMAAAQAKVTEGEIVVNSEDIFSDEDEAHQDIFDAISLLTKAMHLLGYMGDVSVLKVVTRRDRESMVNLSDQIKVYLDAVMDSYVPDEETEV